MSSLPQNLIGTSVAPEDARVSEILRQLCVLPASSLESEFLEIKSWCNSESTLGEKVSEAAMCLANASGGIVLLGIEDGHEHKFAPCPHLNIRCDWIMQRIHDNTVPPVDVQVEDVSDILRGLSGFPAVNAFAVRVRKSKKVGGHQTTAGLAKIRDGNRCKPYYMAEDDRSKAPVPAAAASDLLLDSIEWGMRQNSRAFKTSTHQWGSPYDFLSEIGLLESHVLGEDRTPSFRVTLAALLLFGKRSALKEYCPSFEILVVTPHGDQRYNQNIVESYRELCGNKSARLFALCPTVPVEIIRELVVNAFIHREYRVAAPIVIRALEGRLEIESPGELPGKLTSDSLIHCTPVYRNFLLAEGARYIGICDKIGQGIDRVYESVLSSGFGFPSFDSSVGRFLATVPLQGSREFHEFVRRGAQPLASLDEMITTRLLYERQDATFLELCHAMQRLPDTGETVLREMFRKLITEPVDGATGRWRLTPNMRKVIDSIFSSDQMGFDLGVLFGDR